MTDPVARWQVRLRDHVGMSERERLTAHGLLLKYCETHHVTPVELLARWEEFPDLLARRRPPGNGTPLVAVESFLIHNGVNVFGDILRVAGRPEDMAEQGSWFTRQGGADACRRAGRWHRDVAATHFHRAAFLYAPDRMSWICRMVLSASGRHGCGRHLWSDLWKRGARWSISPLADLQ